MKLDLAYMFVLILFVQICHSAIKFSKKPTRKTLKTKRCKYTFVVREMPEGSNHCPNQVQEIQSDKFAESSAEGKTNPYLSFPSSSKVIPNSRVTELEKRLLAVEKMLEDQTEENIQLNQTITKQEVTLHKSDKMLHVYHKNISSMFRIINYLERTIHKQKVGYRDLEKKVSGIVLDVVEVNNVLSKKVSTFDSTVSLKRKNIQVQSISKILNCGLTNPEATFKDCQDVFSRGHTVSGVYYITPMYSSCSIPVWCDMDTPPGGWLVIQNRNNGETDFNRFWDEYKDGFGNIASEFWLGLDNIFLLSNQDYYEMRTDLWDFEDNRAYALYKNFKLDGERDKYKLHAYDYEGSARNSLKKHNGMKFSTPDQDNDNWPNYHCGREWKAGWWFNNCWSAILTGLYYNNSKVEYRGISWGDWKPEQLAKTQIKIRPSRIHRSVHATNKSQVKKTDKT